MGQDAASQCAESRVRLKRLSSFRSCRPPRKAAGIFYATGSTAAPIMFALSGGVVAFSHLAGLYHRGRGPKPCLAGNGGHRRLIDNADGIPGEQGVARLGAVDPGRNSDLELPREPGERAVTAEA